MQEVVEVRVGNAIARLGPVEERLPALRDERVDVAEKGVLASSASAEQTADEGTHLGQSAEPMSESVL